MYSFAIIIGINKDNGSNTFPMLPINSVLIFENQSLILY